MRFLPITIILGALLLSVTAAASSGLFDIPAGHAYAIGGQEMLSAGPIGVTPTLGHDAQGSVELRAAAGETITGFLGGDWQFFAENQPGMHQLFVAAGDVEAAGFRVRVLPGVTGAVVLDASRGLIVFDTSAGDVDAFLPPSSQHPGREITFSKPDPKYVAHVWAGFQDSVNGAAVVDLESEWSYLRLHSDGFRWLITGRSP